MDQQPATRKQLTLDFDDTMPENRVHLMLAIDQINQRYECGSLKLTCTGAPKAMKLWAMRQEKMSSGVYDGLAEVGGGGVRACRSCGNGT